MENRDTWGRHLAEKLAGQTVAIGSRQAKLLRYLGEGKSSVVVLVEDFAEGALMALKLYDPGFIGSRASEQVERDLRQLATREHTCASLVRTLDVGTCVIETVAHHFALMDYIDGEDFRDRIARHSPSAGEVRRWLGDLLNAVNELRLIGAFHRDIKPENIRIGPDGRLVLLDLGVLKYLDTPELTDHGPSGKRFIGTLRYAPPELLLRREGAGAEAWDAITTYQIGAVLYEMVEGHRIFQDSEDPYAALVLAVLNDIPVITNPRGLPLDIVKATAASLLKDPARRREFATHTQLWIVANGQDVDDETARSFAQIVAVRSQHANLYAKKVGQPRQQAEAVVKACKNTMSEARYAALRACDLYLSGQPDAKGKANCNHETGRWAISVLPNSGLHLGIIGALRMRLVIPLPSDPALVEVVGVGYWSTRAIKDGSDTDWRKIADNSCESIYRGPWLPPAVENAVLAWLCEMEQSYYAASEIHRQLAIEDEHRNVNKIAAGEKVRSAKPPLAEYWFTRTQQHELGKR